jgi:hypothetical protein
MKQAIIVGLVVLLGASSVYAGVKLVKGVEFAQVGIGSDMVTISKFVDGDTTCYVSRHGKFGAHGISCVK